MHLKLLLFLLAHYCSSTDELIFVVELLSSLMFGSRSLGERAAQRHQQACHSTLHKKRNTSIRDCLVSCANSSGQSILRMN